MLSSGTLSDPGKLSDLIDAVKRSVVLDGSWNLLDFVGQMRGVSGGGIEFSTIPTVNVDYRYDPANPKATAVQVDPAQVKAFAAGLIGAPVPAAPAPVVDVSNASRTRGLAARVADVLRDKGFAPGTTGNIGSRRTSLVRFGPDLADRGAEVAKLLGGLTTQADAVGPGRAHRGPAGLRLRRPRDRGRRRCARRRRTDHLGRGRLRGLTHAVKRGQPRSRLPGHGRENRGTPVRHESFSRNAAKTFSPVGDRTTADHFPQWSLTLPHW